MGGKRSDLPGSRPESIEAIPSSQSPAQTGKIMIIDDEPLNIKLAQRYLNRAGYTDFVSVTEDLEAWKKNCPLELLGEGMRANGLLADAEQQTLEREYRAEIAAAFQHAKSSPFPGKQDWKPLNWSPSTPQADRLLKEVDLAEFDARQESVQAKGY